MKLNIIFNKGPLMKFLPLFFFVFLIFSDVQGFNSKGPYLIVNNPHDSGFFAVFTSVIGTLDLLEKDNCSGVKVELDGRYLDPIIGPNWWDYFFESIKIGNESELNTHVITFSETGFTISRGFKIGRERAHELIKKYIKIKKNIKDEINLFARNYFKKNFVIGVHHRGTDKGCECPLVPYEITKNKILEVINNLSNSQKENLKIYVATDEANFLSFMLEHFSNRVIFNQFARSDNGTPLHVGSFYSNNYQRGKEALIDCLLLSKCNILIRPPKSSLSVTAGRFNLNQPQIIVRANKDKSKDTY